MQEIRKDNKSAAKMKLDEMNSKVNYTDFIRDDYTESLFHTWSCKKINAVIKQQIESLKSSDDVITKEQVYEILDKYFKKDDESSYVPISEVLNFKPSDYTNAKEFGEVIDNLKQDILKAASHIVYNFDSEEFKQNVEEDGVVKISLIDSNTKEKITEFERRITLLNNSINNLVTEDQLNETVKNAVETINVTKNSLLNIEKSVKKVSELVNDKNYVTKEDLEKIKIPSSLNDLDGCDGLITYDILNSRVADIHSVINNTRLTLERLNQSIKNSADYEDINKLSVHIDEMSAHMNELILRISSDFESLKTDTTEKDILRDSKIKDEIANINSTFAQFKLDTLSLIEKKILEIPDKPVNINLTDYVKFNDLPEQPKIPTSLSDFDEWNDFIKSYNRLEERLHDKYNGEIVTLKDDIIDYINEHDSSIVKDINGTHEEVNNINNKIDTLYDNTKDLMEKVSILYDQFERDECLRNLRCCYCDEEPVEENTEKVSEDTLVYSVPTNTETICDTDTSPYITTTDVATKDDIVELRKKVNNQKNIYSRDFKKTNKKLYDINTDIRNLRSSINNTYDDIRDLNDFKSNIVETSYIENEKMYTSMSISAKKRRKYEKKLKFLFKIFPCLKWYIDTVRWNANATIYNSSVNPDQEQPMIHPNV